MKSKIFLSVMLLSMLSSIVTNAELYQQTQKNTPQEQRYTQYIEQSKVMLTPEVATCFNNLGFYFYDDMGSEARTVYTRLQENAQEHTPEFSYTTLIPALVQLVDLADKKSILERVAPAVQTYFAQLTAQEAKKYEREKTRAHGAVYADVPYVLNLLVDQALQVGSYLAVNGVAVINKLAVLEALRLPANSICGDALINNSVPDCKLQTITTPGKVANSATTATSNNVPNTIVLRDANGNFSAGTITANLNGTATNAINCLNCPVATGTPLNTPDTLVRRALDGESGFRAGSFAAEDIVVDGNINITTNPSTAMDGNILKAGDLFIHNFGSTTNTFVGYLSGNTTLSGASNTALGANTLSSDTSGFNNVAVGYQALLSNTEGDGNVAVGVRALGSNTEGANNIAIGLEALTNNQTAERNIAIGRWALENHVSGDQNIAIGTSALRNNTDSDFNIAIGATAMQFNSMGERNVAIGQAALLGNDGSSNVAIGFNAGTGLSSGSNNIYVGANVSAGSASETNTIRIGSTQTATFIAGISGATIDATNEPVLVDANGHLGTMPASSRRYKENIAPMADDTQHLLELEPVTFTYKGKNSGKHYGLIAEDVAEKFPELAIYKDGQPESVRYHLIAVMLLNEVKKLANRVDQQQEVIDRLRSLVAQNKENK